jgi:hypothetical protein
MSGPVAEVATAWRNKIEYLPNPAAAGALQPGLAGQIFLYTADAQPATANGRLIIDLIDETPRLAGIPPLTPERWEFTKEVLKNLRTLDERFGECYVVFLPWPTYRPDVTHVRLRVCYLPENGGFPIYAPETRLILNASHGAISDNSNNPPQTMPKDSAPGPGLGTFRFGGSLFGDGPRTTTSSSESRSRLQVIELTPPTRPSHAAQSAVPTPPTPVPPAGTPQTVTPQLPTPPLVPGPLPQ